MRAKSRRSVQKYSQLISDHNTQIINLNNAIKEYGIANCVRAWVDTGVAVPASGKGMYRIVSNNPRKDAVRILTAAHNHNLKIREKANDKPLVKIPDPKPAIIQMERIDKAKKKISILWGMIKIEQ